MTTTLAGALANALEEHNHESRDWTGYCLIFVRSCWEVPARYPSAAVAWHAATDQHTTYPPPPGAAVFWTGGSQGFGHIALSTGEGNVWSTDALHRGQVDHVTIGFINAVWPNEHYVGWTGDLNGFDLPLGLEGEGGGELIDPPGGDDMFDENDRTKATTTLSKVESTFNRANLAAFLSAAVLKHVEAEVSVIKLAAHPAQWLVSGGTRIWIKDQSDLDELGLRGVEGFQVVEPDDSRWSYPVAGETPEDFPPVGG